MTDKKTTKEDLENLLTPFYAKMQKLIPHHREVFENYKFKVNKLITQGYIHELQRETKEKLERIKELEAFQQELNLLRSKVFKTNQQLLDSEFEKHRASINELLQGYSEHMDIVNDIIVSKRTSDSEQVKAELEQISSASFDRFPKTISEFDKYKDEFMKYDALHEFVDDDFLYDVMKELTAGRETLTERREIIEGAQMGGSFSGYETDSNNIISNLKSEASAPFVQNMNDEM